MSRILDAHQIKRCHRAYAGLRRRLARTGFLWTGTVLRQSQPCGKPSCRCHQNRQHHHGPYYVWTRKVEGKTVTRMLSEAEGRLYTEWIKNRRQLDRTIKKMLAISQQMGPLILRQQSPH